MHVNTLLPMYLFFPLIIIIIKFSINEVKILPHFKHN